MQPPREVESYILILTKWDLGSQEEIIFVFVLSMNLAQVLKVETGTTK